MPQKSPKRARKSVAEARCGAATKTVAAKTTVTRTVAATAAPAAESADAGADDAVAAAPAKKAAAKKTAAKKTAVKKTAAKKTAAKKSGKQDDELLDGDEPVEEVKAGKGEEEEGEGENKGFVLSDDDEDDAPAQQVAVAGATADPVKDYLKQIGKVPFLNAEQEVELAKRMEKAGLFAEDKLANADKLAPKLKRELEIIAEDGRRAKPPPGGQPPSGGLPGQALHRPRHALPGPIQEGNLVDPRGREVRLHQGPQVLRVRHLVDPSGDHPRDGRSRRTIRIPVHMVEVINKLARVQRRVCFQDLGREPTPEELAKELDMTPEKVIEVQKYGREPISLHTPLGEDGDSEFGDLIEDSEAVVPADAVSFTLLQEQLHSVLDTLSEREAGVVSMRFGLTDGQPKRSSTRSARSTA
ncbi:RNA polymerase principal sigma factor HrdB [Streptomyces badius]